MQIMVRFLGNLLVVAGLLVIITASLPAQVLTIARARSLPAGDLVTIRGTVTNGAELGSIRYVQDGTAGIAVFPSKEGAVTRITAKVGDSVEIGGVLTYYHNLLQISPVTSYRLLANKRPAPQPKRISLHDVGPDLEAQLVHLDSIHFTTFGDKVAAGVFAVRDTLGFLAKAYMRPGNTLVNIPFDQPLSIDAIVSRYEDAFQLLPLNTKKWAPKQPAKPIVLADSYVIVFLTVQGCTSGKITIKDAAGKEQLFSLAHSSGTTQLDVSALPAGKYVAVVRAQKRTISLPFQKM